MTNKIKPFVQWVGGKSRIKDQIISLFPKDIITYYEPFVGGGAIYFSLQHQDCVISDVNQELIHAYQTVKYNPDCLINILDKYKDKKSREFYYEVANQHYLTNQLDIAVRFIYLNKTCFNGMYRVNKKNQFYNTYGNKGNRAILDHDNIQNCSIRLRGTSIKCQSYDKIKPSEGDFVYMDPPYHGLHSPYTPDKFEEQNQIELKEFCDNLTEKKVKFIVSNSDTDFIKDLYKDYDQSEIKLTKYFNPTSVKKATELLIKNY